MRGVIDAVIRGDCVRHERNDARRLAFANGIIAIKENKNLSPASQSSQ